MQNKPFLDYKDVQQIIQAATTEALANDWSVSIVVCDDGGHSLGLVRLDGAPPISAYIATEKARTSAMGRRPSKSYEDIVANGRIAALTMPMVVHLEGGEPIVIDGNYLGAVGVSGVKSAQDAQIARAGIAAWLTEQTAKNSQ